jgi:hypothetical protein
MVSNHTHAGAKCQILKGLATRPVIRIITNYGEWSPARPLKNAIV